MNPTLLTIAVTGLSVVLIAFLCIRWNAIRDREALWTITKNVIANKRYTLLGIVGGLVYLVVYFVLGGRVILFYGHWVFNVTVSGIIIAVLSAVLVALLLALFFFNLEKLGMLQVKKGSWGIFGTVLAIVVSFCP